MAVIERITRWWRGHPVAVSAPAVGRQRGVVDHIILLDGTFSTLQAGYETNIGLMFKLLAEEGPSAQRNVYYEPGLQWEGWRHGWSIIQGHGFDSLIRRAYGWLASHYRPGDRIFLFGYSRGAYAVRSLAGVIDRVGLLKREHATERGVTLTYRHYQNDPGSTASLAFANRFCHDEVEIEMVGVFDTVKSLGIRWPLLWMLIKDKNGFHNHHLGRAVRHGFQALAMNETRNAFAPVLWDCPPDRGGDIEQMWFRGAHGDVGGQVGDIHAARPLANIPLVWMLEKTASLGLALPGGWHDRYSCDPQAPMVGTMKSWGKWFLVRRKRKMLRDPSEHIHPTVMLPASGGWWNGWFDIRRLLAKSG